MELVRGTVTESAIVNRDPLFRVLTIAVDDRTFEDIYTYGKEFAVGERVDFDQVTKIVYVDNQSITYEFRPTVVTGTIIAASNDRLELDVHSVYPA